MTEAPEKNARQKQNTDDGKEFEEAFKPKKGKTDAGVSKHGVPPKKKAKSRPKKLAVFLLIFVILTGTAGAALYFTGFLNPALERLGLIEPAGDAQLSLEEREALVSSMQAELDKREKNLVQREELLEAKETAQQSEDGDPDQAETFSEKISGLSDNELVYYKKVSSIYSKMDPVQAAAIMESMFDFTEISTILYYMQPAASALVLEQMEAGKAADITEIMLS